MLSGISSSWAWEPKLLGRSLEAYHGYGVRILGFIATPEEPWPDMIRLERNYRVFPLKDLQPVLARQFISYVDLEQIGNTPLPTFPGAPADEALLLVKHGIDVVLASIGIIVLSPVFLLAAALIRLTSKGPAIFRQVRRGLNSRAFLCYKFRSMVADAEQRRMRRCT